ncbi:rhodanese-like domain-containing protein [Bacteroidales bacterium OttesenSCG-928-I14]|nr:rhodanese-like domain-containing protein [Bacteroidales bacterium OttesenSCG-928-I14]
MAGFFSRLFGTEEKPDFKALLESGAMLLDVRTKEEFRQGSASKSVNIPLDSLNGNLSKIKKGKPVIVVCASGARSSSAVSLLKSKGYAEVYNGGSWFRF